MGARVDGVLLRRKTERVPALVKINTQGQISDAAKGEVTPSLRLCGLRMGISNADAPKA